jgi:hypothetical protein
MQYTVRNPSTTTITETLKANLQSNPKLRTPPTGLPLDTREPKNPFSTLPTELVHQICSLLPGDSLESLTQASLYINLITRDNYFWKRFIATDMPWLEEGEAEMLRKRADVTPSADSGSESPINYQRVYQWLDGVTKPAFAMDDEVFMAVANRRRIWGVCEVLAGAYRAQCA